MKFSKHIFLFLFLFSPVVSAKNVTEATIQLQQSIESLSQNLLNLPDTVTADDIRRFERDLDKIKSLVGQFDLGPLNLKAIDRPIIQIEKNLNALKKQKTPQKATLNELRRWSAYLLKMPVTQTFLAKDNVMKGKESLEKKNYSDAQAYLKEAIALVNKIEKAGDKRLAKPLRRIHSEITILYTAALKQEELTKERLQYLDVQIVEAFKTYQETSFNLWSSTSPPLPGDQ